jgi:hypothetical protein
MDTLARLQLPNEPAAQSFHDVFSFTIMTNQESIP